MVKVADSFYSKIGMSLVTSLKILSQQYEMNWMSE